jgi:hypothetical protein
MGPMDLYFDFEEIQRGEKKVLMKEVEEDAGSIRHFHPQ